MINMPIRTVVFPGHFGSELLFKMAHKLIEGISNDRFPGTGSLDAFCQGSVDPSGDVIANLSFRCGSLSSALDFAMFPHIFGMVNVPLPSYFTFSFWMSSGPCFGASIFLFKMLCSVFTSRGALLLSVALAPVMDIFFMACFAFSPESQWSLAFVKFRKGFEFFTLRASSFLKSIHGDFVIQINN